MHPKRLIAASLFIVAGAAYAGTYEKAVRGDFKVPAGGRLTIRTEVGDIDIRPGSEDRVSVDARIGADLRDRKKAAARIAQFKLEMLQRGSEIVVRGEDTGDSSSFWMFSGDDLRVRIVVSVPRRFNVDANTSGGDVVVGNLQGAVKIRTSGGDLRAGDIDGTLHAHTSGGDIHLRSASAASEVHTSGGDISVGRTAGQFKAQTSGGDIRIHSAAGRTIARTSGGDISVQSTSGSLDASTSGGSVEVRFLSQMSGNSKLSTSGGDVVVYLPKTARLNLDAKCSGGRVVSDVPIRIVGKRIDEDELHGTLNGGGPLLALRSSAGRIEIRGR